MYVLSTASIEERKRVCQTCPRFRRPFCDVTVVDLGRVIHLPNQRCPDDRWPLDPVLAPAPVIRAKECSPAVPTPLRDDPPSPKVVKKPCIHLGLPISRTNSEGEPCNSCGGRWLMQCDKHGSTSTGHKRSDAVKFCKECPDYEEDK